MNGGNVRRTLIVAAGLAIAALATAQLTKYKDWPKSPEAYFLTPEERQEWAKVASDTDAEQFIAAYWAKRGGERFKAEVARRIAAADEQFKMRRQKGSESARGRLLIVLGGPSRVSQVRSGAGGEAPDTGLGTAGASATRPGAESLGGVGQGSSLTQTWLYEKDKFDPSLGIGELRLRIVVDNLKGNDELQNRSDADRAIAKLAEKSIVNPSATAAVAGTPSGAPAAAPAGAPAGTAPRVPAVAGTGPATVPPPAPAAASLPAATRSVLEPLLHVAKVDAGPAMFWGGPFRASSGEPMYALQFYFPGDKAPAGPVKFGGLVASDAGGEATSFWEDATLTDMKTGAKTDKVFERSVVLPAGSYHGAFGIFPPDGGTALETASASFKLEPKSSDFDVSPLILTNELKPQTKRPGATDPFIFGVEKPIKVEPKANRSFSKEDSLWYFYAVSNPKVPESAGAPAAAPPPASTPAAGAAAPAAPAAADTVKPRIMQRIGVLRDGKPAFAPFTGPAEMQQLTSGYYASGSEIPLTTFEPGYYTFTLNIRDLNAPRDSAAFKGLDRQADFVVLKPDGTPPDKASAKAAPATTPRPKPKKS
jgi:GWxTD domain-containing protein